MIDMMYRKLLREQVLSATKLGEYCLLSWTKVLRMEPAGGLHVAAKLAASWEGSVACAHAEDDLERGEATIPQEKQFLVNRSILQQVCEACSLSPVGPERKKSLRKVSLRKAILISLIWWTLCGAGAGVSGLDWQTGKQKV